MPIKGQFECSTNLNQSSILEEVKIMKKANYFDSNNVKIGQNIIHASLIDSGENKMSKDMKGKSKKFSVYDLPQNPMSIRSYKHNFYKSRVENSRKDQLQTK